MGVATISDVRPESEADRAGVRKGDVLLRINGRPIRDIIDYELAVAGDELVIEVLRTGEPLALRAEAECGRPFGVVFDQPTFDGVRRCKNRCVFCFVDQLPSGLRSSLYVKDDDYRLSFFQGSFVTLTNLGPEDWDRIEDQRLSPLYVSVHSTDPKTRAALLGRNPGQESADPILHQLRRLKEAGIQCHTQIVLCPGINDGENLEKTLVDLVQLWPAVQSVAIVPVGLVGPGRRPGSPAWFARRVTPGEAASLVRQIGKLQADNLRSLGTRLVWLSDEFHFLSGDEPPAIGEYEDLPQLQNGVGISAVFRAEFEEGAESPPRRLRKRRAYSIVTGLMAGGFVSRVLSPMDRVAGLDLDLLPVPNSFFGEGASVSGLLAGQDLADALKDRSLGDEVLVPAACLRTSREAGASAEDPVFLDGMSLSELSEILGRPVVPVSGGGKLAGRLLNRAGRGGGWETEG